MLYVSLHKVAHKGHTVCVVHVHIYMYVYDIVYFYYRNGLEHFVITSIMLLWTPTAVQKLLISH